MSNLPVIAIGSYVYWTDPDRSSCNAIGTVQAISENLNDEVDEHSIYTVKLLSGGIVEAPRSELTLIANGSTVRSVVASTPTGRPDAYDLCAHLSREADVEIMHQTCRICPVDRYFIMRAKKGPRTTRIYHIPPKRWAVDMKRGKHRGHLPLNMGGDRLYALGCPTGAPRDINEVFLNLNHEEMMKEAGLSAERFNEEFKGGLLITPELQESLRAKCHPHLKPDDGEEISW